MKHAPLLLVVAFLAAVPLAPAGDPPIIIEIPMDAQINIGRPGTADSPNGDAIYVPTWNTEDYIEFRADEPEGYCRLWINGLDPNASPGYYYGPYIDFWLAGFIPEDEDGLFMAGHSSILEYDCRYRQGPNNGNPYQDAPIGNRLYTYIPHDEYQGWIQYVWPYQTGPGNQCDPKPTGYPEWWHVTIDLDDMLADFWCDGTPDVHTGDNFDLASVNRMRFWGTDWNGGVLGPVDDWIDVKNVRLTLYPPPCAADVDDDGDTDLGDLATLLADYLCDEHTEVVAFDTNGFEAPDYVLGPLPGQQGWVSETSDPDPNDPYVYDDPEVINDPTGAGMGQVVKFDPADGDPLGGWSGASRLLDTPISGAVVTFEWDQWRADLGDNAWVADGIWDGWWAIQWDSASPQAASAAYFSGWVPLTAGQWQHVIYTIDLSTQLATVNVDGTEESAYFGDDDVDGFYMDVTTTGVSGDGPLYLDNLVITYHDVCPVDFDDDGDTDLSDLAFLLSDYNCEPVWP